MDPAPLPPASGATPWGVVQLLRAGGGALLGQALLHGELARLDWQEEKQRLQRILALTLLGFAGLLCALLFAGGLVIALAWDSAARVPAFAALVVLYAAGAALAWRRIEALARRGDQAFAALREELAADAAVLRASL